MINRVVLVGNLTRDPQFNKTQSGKSYARFTVAVNRRFGGKDEADFVSCVAWERTADFISQYAKKGTTVGVEGRITTGSYDDKTTGKKVYTTDVTCENVQLIGSRNQSSEPQQTSPAQPKASGGYYPDAEVSDDDFNTGPLLDISSDDLPF